MRLILHNLKKGRRQFISFGIMILICAMIMNIALVLNFQTSKAYDRVFDELNTADINILIPKDAESDDIRGKIEEISGTERTEAHEGIFVTATVCDFAGSDFDMNTVFYPLYDGRELNIHRINGETDSKDGIIYIPEYISKLGQFETGEKITYRIDGKDNIFTVGGTVSEMQYGNYGTGMIGIFLPQTDYDTFSEEFSDKRVTEYSVKTKENADLAEIKKNITSLFASKNIPVLSIGDRDTAKQTRTMVCDLLIMIFLALAFIILLVSLFLSGFRIRNSMEDEMTSMGVLKAIGYTSDGIMAGVVTPYAFIGSVSAAIGVILSYLILPFIAGFLAIQSGFSYTPHFDTAAFALSIFIPALLILAFSVLSARKIRRLEPIWAIRGVTGKEGGKNILPLENAKSGIKFKLILKQIFSSPMQNILLFVLSFGVMILLSFAGTLFYNVNIKPDNFTDTISEESPSVILTAKEGKADELRSAIEKDTEVKTIIEYATVNASYPDGSLKCFVCEDFSLVTNDICYRGNNPSGKTDIALGSALEEKYPIGSTVEITNGEKSFIFTVSGYIQSVNNSGNVCELTSEGYGQISDTDINSFNIYLEKGRSAAFIEKYEKENGSLIASSLDYEKLKESGQKMYAGIVSAVTVVLLIISSLVVLLVMYIMIGSMITRRKQEFGIYKAIGWSNKQLVTQTAMCFVPVIAISAILSATAGSVYMPKINNFIFGMLGAIKNRLEVPIWFLMIFALLIIGISYLICAILSKPIKKITAYSLLKE